MTKVTITSAALDKAVEITAHAAAAAMDAAIGKTPRRRPGKREREAAKRESGSNAERIEKYREKLTGALLVSAVHPSPDVRHTAVEVMLCMPSFSPGQRYAKYKTIAEAAWPDVEFSTDLMMSWSVDEGLPLEQRLVGSLLLDLALGAAIQHDEADPSANELAPTAASPSTGIWDEAVNRLEAATSALSAAQAAEEQFDRDLELAAPTPDVLVIDRHPDGRPRRQYLVESVIEAEKDLSFDKKVELIGALRTHQAAEEIAKERLGFQAVTDAASAAFDERQAAQAALAALPPPNLEALAYKAWAIIAEDCLQDEHARPDQDNIGLLLRSDGDGYAAVKIYQDIVRLAGGPAEISDYRGFDPAAWLAEFESKPGCEFDTSIGPYYDDQLAYDTPLIRYQEDFTVNDPIVCKRFHASFAGTPDGDEYLAERRARDPEFDTRPFVAHGRENFERMFEATDPRLNEWTERYERCVAEGRAIKAGTLKPTYAHLWDNLAPWQKDAVKSHVAAAARARKAGQ